MNLNDTEVLNTTISLMKRYGSNDRQRTSRLRRVCVLRKMESGTSYVVF